MAYTPELSQERSAALRRMAWAMDIPMTKTLGLIVDMAVEWADGRLVCDKCRDKSLCSNCAFNHHERSEANAGLLGYDVKQPSRETDSVC